MLSSRCEHAATRMSNNWNRIGLGFCWGLAKPSHCQRRHQAGAGFSYPSEFGLVWNAIIPRRLGKGDLPVGSQVWSRRAGGVHPQNLNYCTEPHPKLQKRASCVYPNFQEGASHASQTASSAFVVPHGSFSSPLQLFPRRDEAIIFEESLLMSVSSRPPVLRSRRRPQSSRWSRQ